MQNRLKTLIVALILVCGGMLNSAIAQDGIITGTVKDAETGELMRSVTVRLKDTKKGAFSDVKGKYTIKDMLWTLNMHLINIVLCHKKEMFNCWIDQIGPTSFF